MLDLIIKNGDCFISGKLQKKDIGVLNGKITQIEDSIKDKSKDVLEANKLIVLPGCIDTQVHFREPGSTDTEDLNSGSKAAIVGGITVYLKCQILTHQRQMKKNSKKLNLAKDRMFCNYAFYFGATPTNQSELSKLKNLEGCCGVKLFAGSSTGNLLVHKEEDIEKVFEHTTKVVSVHSEDEDILNQRKKLRENGNVLTHQVWRNEETAMSSTRRIVKIAKRLNKKLIYSM